MQLMYLIELETQPYNFLALQLILKPEVIEKFVVDNNIDLRAFMVFIKKSNTVDRNRIKSIISGKNDIYSRNKLISTFRKK